MRVLLLNFAYWFGFCDLGLLLLFDLVFTIEFGCGFVCCIGFEVFVFGVDLLGWVVCCSCFGLFGLMFVLFIGSLCLCLSDCGSLDCGNSIVHGFIFGLMKYYYWCL